MIWIKLIIFVLITYGLILLVNHFLRSFFHIEKRKKSLLVRDYVNDSHKRIDKIVSRITVFVLLICLYLTMYREFSFNFFMYMLILTHSIEYGVHAYFERKDGDDPNQAILIISEFLIVAIAALTIIQFDLLFV